MTIINRDRWIPVVSAVGAILLLIIISFILHKVNFPQDLEELLKSNFQFFYQCGFFKRDRPGQPPNKQTDTNTNDYALDESNNHISEDSNSDEESAA